MKRISIFLIFIAISISFTGCYTQFIIPERYEENDKYVQRDNDEEQYDEAFAEESDSTDAGYRYFDDYRNDQFHYYSPIYSRYYWGYYPGRIGFYDYGCWSDNYWAYGWWQYSPFYYDFYWHNNYYWSYYDWPYYYPRYNNGYYGGGGLGRYASNPFSKERGNDGERLGFRRGSGNDRYSSSTRSSVVTSGTSGGRNVVSGRSSTTTLGKESTRTATSTATTTRQSTRSGEKVYRNYDNSGRSRTGSRVSSSTPRQLGYSSPATTSRGDQSSSSSRTGRVTTSSGSSRSGSTYSAPSSSRGSSSGSSSGRSSSGSSSSGSRGGSSSSGSSSSGRGSSGGGGRGR